MVDVTNPETGDEARVVVVRRLDDPGVFMVFSEAAAQELALESGESSTVRATPVQLPGLTAVSPNEDLPFHPDPDVNPAASFGDPNAALVRPPEAGASTDGAERSRVAAAPPTESDAPAEPESEPEPEPKPDAEPEPEPEPQPEPTVADSDVPDQPREESVTEAPEVRITALPIEPISTEDAAPEEPEAEDAEDEAPEADERRAAEDERAPADEASPEDREDSLSVTIPVLPPESEPLPVTELEPPILPSEEPDETAEPEVRIVVDVPEDETPPPNPVRVSATVPDDESDAPRIAEVDESARSDLAEDEVGLPLVAATELEEDREVARLPDEPERSPVEAAPLRPGLIPEDAIVSLEPAEFRSPDPPPEPSPEEQDASDEVAQDEPELIAEVGTEPTPEPEEVPDAQPQPESEPAPDSESEPESASEPATEPPSETVPTPEPGPETEIASAPADSPDDDLSGSLPLVERLDSGAAYVQVAAFTTAQSVRRTIDSLSGGWPVAVMAQKTGDRSVYRVYVGPLAEDEKGSVLYRVRNEGFRDAFVW
jgi:hypothetical protein